MPLRQPQHKNIQRSNVSTSFHHKSIRLHHLHFDMKNAKQLKDSLNPNRSEHFPNLNKLNLFQSRLTSIFSFPSGSFQSLSEFVSNVYGGKVLAISINFINDHWTRSFSFFFSFLKCSDQKQPKMS